jgi:hypothetical protein
MNTLKQCKTCKEIKNISLFAKHSSTKDRLQQSCKECDNARNREWYKRNKEYKLEYCKEYREENKEVVTERGKKYYQNNREKVLQYQKNYRDSDKSKGAAKAARRRSRLLKRTPKWLTKEEFGLIEAKYAIARWLSEVVGIPYEVDHIIPLQGKYVSGLHTPDNLSIIKAKENREKGNKYTL